MKRKMKLRNIGHGFHLIVGQLNYGFMCGPVVRRFLPCLGKQNIIPIEVELIPVSKKKACEFELVIQVTRYDIYIKTGTRKIFMWRVASACNTRLAYLFKGLKKSEYYGLHVHYEVD